MRVPYKTPSKQKLELRKMSVASATNQTIPRYITDKLDCPWLATYNENIKENALARGYYLLRKSRTVYMHIY